jgi:hypothetical protein
MDAYPSSYLAPPRYSSSNLTPQITPGYEQFSLITGLPKSGITNGHAPAEDETNSHAATRIETAFGQQNFPLCWTILATASFGITAWFVRATFSDARLAAIQQTVHLSLSNTLGILRTLQEATSVLTGLVLNQAFETIEWSLATGTGGVRALSFLSISPTTSLLGALGIAAGRRGAFTDRLWAIFRYVQSERMSRLPLTTFARLVMVGVVWAAGFVLFCGCTQNFMSFKSANNLKSTPTLIQSICRTRITILQQALASSMLRLSSLT